MRGQNATFCQPTIASIFDCEPQSIATRATVQQQLLFKWLVSPVWFQNVQICGYVHYSYLIRAVVPNLGYIYPLG